MFKKLRQGILSWLESSYGSYVTMHRRPMRDVDFNRFSSSTPHLPPYAVILRGILVDRYDFTVETVKMYKKLFPGAPLIISTLESAPANIVEQLQQIDGVHVVFFKKTSPVGYGHVNDQIESAKAGLSKAQELGAQYVLLVRVDQRIYATDVYQYLYALTESFPLASGTPQQKRIVALGFNTIKYRTYSMNDMIFFGTLSDVTLYWDIPHDTRAIDKLYTVGAWVKARVCEGYLFTTFLKSVGHPMRDTLEDYWEALGKYFILIDSQDLDWYWIKYARYQEYRDKQYAGVTLGEHINFKDWVTMYKKIEDTSRLPINLEEVANDTHNAPILFEK